MNIAEYSTIESITLELELSESPRLTSNRQNQFCIIDFYFSLFIPVAKDLATMELFSRSKYNTEINIQSFEN